MICMINCLIIKLRNVYLYTYNNVMFELFYKEYKNFDHKEFLLLNISIATK